jgi:hypothetical protein
MLINFLSFQTSLIQIGRVGYIVPFVLGLHYTYFDFVDELQQISLTAEDIRRTDCTGMRISASFQRHSAFCCAVACSHSTHAIAPPDFICLAFTPYDTQASWCCSFSRCSCWALRACTSTSCTHPVSCGTFSAAILVSHTCVHLVTPDWRL